MNRPWTITIPMNRLKVALVLGFDLLFAACLGLPGIWNDVGARNAILFSLAGFLAWQAALTLELLRGGRPALMVEPHFRKNHILQVVFQGLVLLYWGLYYRDAFDHLYQVVVQLMFAFVLDMTLAWTLRRSWYLGFAVAPIVTSTNFFIWFEHGQFWVQLSLIAGALLSKTFVTWMRDGKRTHVFNPTALPLAAISLILLLTNHTSLGRGADLPTSYQLQPNIFEVIFLVGLLVNTQFQTVLLTGSVVATFAAIDMVLQHAMNRSITILPLLPPVFFAATLLLPDPVTTPRSKAGKVFAGALYASCVTVFIMTFHSGDQPSYYDKILAVPIINLLTPWLDRVGARAERVLRALLGQTAELFKMHVVHVALWTAFFIWYMPELKENRVALFPPPNWVLPSPEVTEARNHLLQLCEAEPRVCRPFALNAELNYWLNDRRFHEPQTRPGRPI